MKASVLTHFPLAVLAFSMCFTSALTAGTIPIAAGFSGGLIGRQLDILEDITATMTAEQAAGQNPGLYIPNSGDIVNKKFSNSAFWIKARIENKTDSPVVLVLDMQNPMVDEYSVYLQDSSGTKQTFTMGDKRPHADRPLHTVTFASEIRLEPKSEMALLLRIRTTSSVFIPIMLFKRDAYYEHATRLYLFYGIIIGVSVLVILYNFLLFLSLRDINYLYYSAYILMYFCTAFSITGILFEYLWPNSIWLANEGFFVFSPLATLLGAQFTRNFLQTRTTAPWLHRVMSVFMLLEVVRALLLFLIPLEINGQLAVLSGTITAPQMFIAGIVCLYRKQRQARFFVLAWSLTMAGLGLYILLITDIIPYHFVFFHGLELGYASDAALLSLALADRIRLLRLETQTAQEKAWRQEQLLLSATTKAKDELEIKVAERTIDLERSKEQAESATRLKDKFVSLVAHDLKGPLGAIRGFLELSTEAGTPKEEAKHYIERATANINALLEMIEKLLDIGRLQTGRLTLKKTYFNLHLLVQEKMQKLSGLADVKNIRVENDIHIRTALFADRALIGEVILNVLNNAIKFTPRNGHIRIFTPTSGTFAISDTGSGIDAEILPNIFKHEIKTSTIGTAGERGTGLGLPFCRDIMEAHNGSISVETGSEGSVFCVTFPKMRPIVLLVDDQEVHRVTMREVLTNISDVDIVETHSGKEAMEILHTAPVRLVISDIHMPEMNGLNLLREIRAEFSPEALPVIISTAITSSDSSGEGPNIDTRTAAFDWGANDFILKPIIQRDFIPRVKRYLP